MGRRAWISGVRRRQCLWLDVLLGHIRLRLAGAVLRVRKHVVKGLAPAAWAGKGRGQQCVQHGACERGRCGRGREGAGCCCQLSAPAPPKASITGPNSAQFPPTASCSQSWRCMCFAGSCRRASPGSLSTPICCTHSSLARHSGSQPMMTPLWHSRHSMGTAWAASRRQESKWQACTDVCACVCVCLCVCVCCLVAKALAPQQGLPAPPGPCLTCTGTACVVSPGPQQTIPPPGPRAGAPCRAASRTLL